MSSYSELNSELPTHSAPKPASLLPGQPGEPEEGRRSPSCICDVENGFALNLDDVSEQLGIPIDTLADKFQACSYPPDSARTSMLPQSVRASSSCVPEADDEPAGGSAPRYQRESSYLTPKSPSSRERTSLLDPKVSPSSKPRRKKKRVHFPDNVVKSVYVVPGNEIAAPELRITYNRPWYAYVLFLASNVFFVLTWTEIMKAAWPSIWPGESLQAGVSVVSFISFAFASVFLLFYLLLTWRPLPDEIAALRSKWFVPGLIKTLLYGTTAQVLLTISCMLHITAVNTVGFTTAPLLVTFMYEKVLNRAITSMDSLGTAIAAIGMIVLCVGEERADIGDRVHRFGAIVTSMIGGVLMAPYLTQLRTTSREVSNALVITITVLLSTGVAAGLSGIAGGFTAPLGNGNDRVSAFSDLSSTELLRVMLSGAYMFFFWFLHHTVALYFDKLSIVAGYSLCAPIVLVTYHIQGLPTMSHIFEGIGGALVTIGCSTVVFSGWYHRMNVGLRIEVDQR